LRGYRLDDLRLPHEVVAVFPADDAARPAVSAEEVEEALVGELLVLRGPDGRYLAYGRAEHGRWVFVVYVIRPRGRVRVLPARDMTERERRLNRRKRRGRS
jgi:uncharacterized DUF497 family protein